MAHETRISPEIEANPDWAAAVRRADGWVRLYVRDNPQVEVIEWAVKPGVAGEPVFSFRMVVSGVETRRDFTLADMADRWVFSWRVSDARGQAIRQSLRDEFAGIKQVLREWADELRAEEQTVAAEN